MRSLLNCPAMPNLTADFAEYEYNNRARVPEHPAIFSRWAEASRDARARLGGRRDVPYGQHSRQVMDLFMAGDRQEWVVFLHGGYWRAFSKDEATWLAEPWCRRGVSVAIPNYRLCPEVGIGEIVDDCRLAVATLARLPAAQAATKVTLVGHSAGGHLVAMLLAGLLKDRASLGFADLAIAGVSLSGLFDLEPLTLVSVNQDLRLTDEAARTLSPIHLAAPTRPLAVFVGERETSEYHRQSRLIQSAWPDAVASVRFVPGANHFTILDAVANGQIAAV